MAGRKKEFLADYGIPATSIVSNPSNDPALMELQNGYEMKTDSESALLLGNRWRSAEMHSH